MAPESGAWSASASLSAARVWRSSTRRPRPTSTEKKRCSARDIAAPASATAASAVSRRPMRVWSAARVSALKGANGLRVARCHKRSMRFCTASDANHSLSGVSSSAWYAS